MIKREEKVDRIALDLFFKVLNLELNKICSPKSNYAQRQDWGEATGGSVFYGRTEELAKLERWLINERCRLVAVLGMGGIGKTALSIKLGEQTHDKFEYIIWRSLRDAPPIKAILANLIQFLSDEEEMEADLPESVGERVSILIDYLRSNRCLLILDNVESILVSGSRAGKYIEGYEEYGDLLRRVGETTHISSLVLTSREKPKEVAFLEGETLPVRSLRLSGLTELDGQEVLEAKGLCGSESEFKTLIERYTGNALALKIVATTILDLFDGKIAEFLRQETSVFGDIYELLDQQFERLSDLEKELMYWLAINREPISHSDLREDLIVEVPRSNLVESVESLGRRSLIEKNTKLLMLQPVVMEYVTNQFIEKVCEEIIIQEIDLFRRYALIKATAKDYVRNTQIRVILQPVINELLAVLRSKKGIEKHLIKILAKLQEEAPLEPGYTVGNIFNLLCQMDANLSGYDFSNLAIWQADLRGRILHNVNFSYADFAKSVFTKTFSSISCVAFSPDGELLATSDTNGEISLWRGFADGEQLFSLTEHTGWVRQVAFSPDGQTLVSCSTDKTLKLWDVSTGECLKTLRGHGDRVRTVAFSPDGQIIASGSDDQTVKLWNASTGECLKTLQEHTDAVWSVAFIPDGHTLASGSADSSVKLWKVSTSECLKTLRRHTGCIWSVAFSPDSQTIASGSDDQTVKLWDANTNECLKTLRGHTSRIESVIFSREGQTLATCSDDQTVKLWDVRTGQCCNTLRGHSSYVRSVAFSPKGRTLTSGSDDQTVKLWDINTHECLRTSQGYSNGVWSIAWSLDGKTLASSSDDQTVKLWNVSTGQYYQTLRKYCARVRAVAFSPEGKTLACGGEAQTVKLWDASTGQCLKTLREHVGCIRTVAFSPDGHMLATGSEDQMVKLWDVSTGQCLRTLEHRSELMYCSVTTVAFSPDGQTIASGSDDQTVRLWDVRTGQCFRILEHSDAVLSIAFNPDGKTLASGGKDQTLKLWDLSIGQCLKTFQGHTSWVMSVAFSRDGQILASGSIDKTVKLWAVGTGQCLKTFQGHTHWIHSVAFCPDGQTLASGSADETVKLWNLSTGECLKTLRNSKPYESMKISGATGLTEATIASVKVLGAIDDQEDIFVN